MKHNFWTIGAVLAHKEGSGTNQPKTKPVWWAGDPVACDICTKPYKQVMYDARTSMGGWGNLCQICFNRYGVGLGTGKGQRYSKQENGRWLKTGG